MPLSDHIGQILRWDRFNGNLYIERKNERQYLGSWRELTDTQVISTGRNLAFKERGYHFRWTAPNWADPYVIPLQGNSFQVMNPIRPEEVNQNPSLAGGYQAGYNYKVLSPGGDTYEIRNAETWMAPAGKRLIINPAIGNRGMYAWVESRAPGDSTEPDALPPGFRYATAKEATDRALAATILHDNHKELRELMDEGIYANDGSRITDEYDASLWIIENGSFDVTPFNSAIFSYVGSYATL